MGGEQGWVNHTHTHVSKEQQEGDHGRTSGSKKEQRPRLEPVETRGNERRDTHDLDHG